MDQLEGKVAVVTGGGSGIGQGIVGACAQAGMRVVVSDIELDAAERVADAARETGGEAIAVQADVADGLAMDALAERTYEAFGAAHLLCNHAGVIIETPIVERTDGDWEWLFRVNVMGVVHGIQAFVPRRREHAAHAPRHDEPDDRGGRSERGRDRGVLLHDRAGHGRVAPGADRRRPLRRPLRARRRPLALRTPPQPPRPARAVRGVPPPRRLGQLTTRVQRSSLVGFVESRETRR